MQGFPSSAQVTVCTGRQNSFVKPGTPTFWQVSAKHGTSGPQLVPIGFAVPVHTPVLHMPSVRHGSVQAMPLTGTWRHPTTGLHESIVHELPSSQFLAVVSHCPVAGLQSAIMQRSAGGAHVTGLEPAHSPSWHTPGLTQAIPTLHCCPNATPHHPAPITIATQKNPVTRVRMYCPSTLPWERRRSARRES